MKNIIIIAALMIAAASPLRAQEWVRVNDSTWIRNRSTDVDYAYKVDNQALLYKINNDLRAAALYQVGAWGTGVATAIMAGSYVQEPTNSRLVATIALGVVTFGLEVASVCHIYQRRVFLSPEGIAIRIGKTESTKKNRPK